MPGLEKRQNLRNLSHGAVLPVPAAHALLSARPRHRPRRRRRARHRDLGVPAGALRIVPLFAGDLLRSRSAARRPGIGVAARRVDQLGHDGEVPPDEQQRARVLVVTAVVGRAVEEC